MRNTPGKILWQRNYWEHIIRNESEYGRIAEYIRNNPAKWELDRLYVGIGAVGEPPQPVGAICESPLQPESPQPEPPLQVRESSPSYGEEPWMV